MDDSNYTGYLLEIANSAIADANGNASVQFQPVHTNEFWEIVSQRVSNVGPSIPQVLVYNTVQAPIGFIEGTRDGLIGASNTVFRVYPGETIIYIWTNCTPGTTCTVLIRGTRYVAF